MKLYDSNKKRLYDLEFDGKGKETYLVSACYEDGTEVPEEELDYVSDSQCFCYQCRESS